MVKARNGQNMEKKLNMLKNNNDDKIKIKKQF